MLVWPRALWDFAYRRGPRNELEWPLAKVQVGITKVSSLYHKRAFRWHKSHLATRSRETRTEEGALYVHEELCFHIPRPCAFFTLFFKGEKTCFPLFHERKKKKNPKTCWGSRYIAQSLVFLLYRHITGAYHQFSLFPCNTSGCFPPWEVA